MQCSPGNYPQLLAWSKEQHVLQTSKVDKHKHTMCVSVLLSDRVLHDTAPTTACINYLLMIPVPCNETAQQTANTAACCP